MSYGSVSGVIGFARTWTRGGSFYDASDSPLVAPTRPTVSEVEEWLDLISAAFDTALQNEGFTTPVDESDAPNIYKQLTLKVNTLTADLCAFANSQGRLYTDRALQVGAFTILNKEISDWVKGHVTGIENDGVPRTLPSSNYTGGFSVAPNRQG